MKNKIIFMSNGYKGGATKFQKQHMDYLLKKNNKIILIDDNPEKTFDKPNKKIIKVKTAVNKPSIISKKTINNILNNGEREKILFITNFVFLIKFFFILNDFKKKNKIVLTIHSGILDLNIKTYILGFIFSLIYKMVDNLNFGSNSAKAWWQSKYPWMNISNSKVFYNGINIKKNIKVKKVKKKIKISFIGRLEKENNPDLFINIAQKYLLKNSNAIFNIFGDGSLVSKLKKKHLSKKIIFHGWCEDRFIYKKSDIVLITSPINNYPYVALESKSYGIPVISVSKGDIKKIIKNKKDGIIKYTESTREIINIINKVIVNYERFSKNALINVKKFDLNFSCKNFWENL
tara:strand:+ start:276 stop:1316 length:1041 start_codon:yes stop_codon:yes gene_type:complete